MKKMIVIGLFLVAVIIVWFVQHNSNVKYFPENAFGDSRVSKVLEPAYSEVLRILDEPSIYEIGKNTSEKSIRIMFAPSFKDYFIIRVRIDSNNNGKLYYKVLSNNLETILEDIEMDLDSEIISEINIKTNETNLWSQKSIFNYNVLDGADWIIEGKENNQYHFICRNYGDEGSLEKLIDFLCGLTQRSPMKNYLFITK